MHDLILIKGLRFECIVGINPDERINPQPVQLDLEIGTDISTAAANEDIGSTVDYGEIAIAVEVLVKARQFLLLETLAEQTTAMILDRWLVSSVRLTVLKPHAIAHADAAGISIYRCR
jgi:7,8-dihydroneopterin aldolase/epimerase/oxygenase